MELAIRSGKHYSSTAYTHGVDLNRLGLKELDKVVKHKNAVKPIGMLFCDGGPGENPRFRHHFYVLALLKFGIVKNSIGAIHFRRPLQNCLLESPSRCRIPSKIIEFLFPHDVEYRVQQPPTPPPPPSPPPPLKKLKGFVLESKGQEI